MDDKSLNRTLALLVFVNGAIAAALMGVMSYTFVTGELPFGLQSMAAGIRVKQDKALTEASKLKSKNRAPEPEADSPNRVDEAYLAGFANDLKKEREKIAAERSAIEEQRKGAELIMKQAQAMQAEVEAKEANVDSLLAKVSAKERANVQDMQKIVAGMDVANSTAMILSMDETLAARLLNSMNKKIASQVVSEAMKKKDSSEKIKSITKRIQTLSDELKEDAQK